MKEKIKSIISPKIFLAFCITEILILVTLKILQAIFPYSVIEVPPMFSAILLNALFMLLLVIRVNGKGKDPEITGIPLAVFTTLLADCFLVLLHGLSKAELIRFITPLTANMIGFFIFGIVQVIYAFYLGLTKR